MLEQMIVIFDGDISVRKLIDKKMEKLSDTLKE